MSFSGCIGVAGVDFNVVMVWQSVGVFGRYMLIQAKSVRSSAVLFHILNVGPVRPPWQSFEWEAGKANKPCIFHCEDCPSQTRNCFGSPCAMCN